MLRFIFITSVLLFSSLVAKKDYSNLLYGDWYGGHGEKYTQKIKRKNLIQRLPAEHLLFNYSKENTFYHSGRGTKTSYLVEKNKIYYDVELTDKKRYYIIEKLTTDSLVVTGPYIDSKELFTKDKVVYRLRYYRKR